MNLHKTQHLLLHTPRRLIADVSDWMDNGGPTRLRELAMRVVFGALLLIGLVVALWMAAAGRAGPRPISAPNSPPVATSAGAEARPAPVAPAPPVPATPAPGPAAAQGLPNGAGGSYTVIIGDTLAAVGLRYGVPFEQLAADNGIVEPNRITPGRRLQVGPPAKDVVVIQPGATLSAYAASSGSTVTALMALNPHISNADRIPAGGTLRLPVEALR